LVDRRGEGKRKRKEERRKEDGDELADRYRSTVRRAPRKKEPQKSKRVRDIFFDVMEAGRGKEELSQSEERLPGLQDDATSP